MKNCTIRKPLASSILMMLLVLWQFSAANAQSYNLPIKGSDAIRCGAGELTLSVTWSDATLNPANVKWYTVPFYGTPIASGMSYTTPYIEFTQVYYVDYVGEDGCSQCDRLLIRAVVADQVIIPQVIYPSLLYCNTANQEFVPVVIGADIGTWAISSHGSGNFNSSNGGFNPIGLAGAYVVTFNPEEIEGCDTEPVHVTLNVTTAPAVPTISYPEPQYCSSNGSVSTTQTGATGGTYTASPSGLTINSLSGSITPASSQTGAYTVTYLVPGGGGCAPVSAITSVSIRRLPTASINYAGPFTQNQGAQAVTLTGTDDFTGGTFSADPVFGLSLNATTGEVTPSASTAGTYTVTYTKANVSPCSGDMKATTSVSIFELPSAAIASNATDVCLDGTEPEVTFTGTGGAEPYTFTYQIGTGPIYEITTTSGSSVSLNHPTQITGVYSYKVLSVKDNNNSTRTYAANDEPSVTINVAAPQVATFEYAETPYCSNSSNPSPTLLAGGVAGTFSATPGLVFVDTATGEINISESTAGMHTVTNTIAATSGCEEVTATNVITITALPSAVFSYESTSYCLNATNPTPTITGTAGGIFSATAGMVINASTGEIDIVNSTVGTHTVSYFIVAGDGCVEVSSTFGIEILDLPAANAGNNAGICAGQSIQIGAGAVVGSTYSWVSDPAGFTSTEAQPTVNPSVTTIYTVTESNGTCSNTGSVTIFLLNAPVANPILGIDNLCAGSTATFTSTTYEETSNYVWSYSGTGATISEQTIVNEKVQVVVTFSNTATSGTLTLTETANCATSNTLFIALNPLPANPTAIDITAVYDGTLMTGSATSLVQTIDQSTGASTGTVSATINWYDALTNGTPTVAPNGTDAATYTAYAEAVSPTYGCISAERTLVTVGITKRELSITANDYDKGFGEALTSPTTGSTAFTVGVDQLAGSDNVTSVTLTYLEDVHTSGKAVGTYTNTIEPRAAQGTGLDNYTINYVNGNMTIYEAIVESTTATKSNSETSTRKGYHTLKAAYDAINAGTHTGVITINIYANITETETATLNANGIGSASYTSVSLIPENNVIISGSENPVMIFGNTDL